MARLCNAHELPLYSEEKKVVNALLNCRTAELGGHKDTCDSCGHEEHFYNSCRNRHCPKCGSFAKENWLKEREKELLPVGYFHMVFTVPHTLNRTFMWNKNVLYDSLMTCAKQTLLEAAAHENNLGVKAGMISILHTWGQNLDYHPHVHCIIPGGGFEDKKWIPSKKNFYIEVKKLSELFRGKLLSAIKRHYKSNNLVFSHEDEKFLNPKEFYQFLGKHYKEKWVVYCKPPFNRPQTVLKYLSRYTHRVAISNHRIVKIADGKVHFMWKDYRTNKQKVMVLELREFLRRFLMHVLPKRFVKIRFSGFLANRNKTEYIAMCREQNGVSVFVDNDPFKIDSTNSVEMNLFDESNNVNKTRICLKCKTGTMQNIFLLSFYVQKIQSSPG